MANGAETNPFKFRRHTDDGKHLHSCLVPRRETAGSLRRGLLGLARSIASVNLASPNAFAGLAHSIIAKQPGMHRSGICPFSILGNMTGLSPRLVSPCKIEAHEAVLAAFSLQMTVLSSYPLGRQYPIGLWLKPLVSHLLLRGRRNDAQHAETAVPPA